MNREQKKRLILKELRKDSRMAFTEIGRRIGIPKSTVFDIYCNDIVLEYDAVLVEKGELLKPQRIINLINKHLNGIRNWRQTKALMKDIEGLE